MFENNLKTLQKKHQSFNVTIMKKTLFSPVVLLPMCSSFSQKAIKKPIFGFGTLSGSMTKTELTADLKSNKS